MVDSKGFVACLSFGKATITVTSIDNKEIKDSVDLTVVSGGSNDNYKVDTHVTDKIDMQKVNYTGSLDSLPGKSTNSKLLAIPVEFSDYPFASDIKDDINTLCNGNNEDGTTGYWESISSYYSKSSYGKLDFSVTVGDIYRPINPDTNEQYKASDMKNKPYTVVLDFLRDAVSAYKAATGSTCQEFDSDSNGFIDSVYLIYSTPSYAVVSSLNHGIFWAWTFWDYKESPVIDNPIANAFFWASQNFMDEEGKNVIDAHTFIHETGHLLGANDYYNYDSSNQAPMGKIDMMDYNIGDHSMWTKMSFGWVDPIVVTGDARITIKSSQAQDDVILLVPDNWNGTPFDEMLTLKLSTPRGLNELDSKPKYTESRPLVYTKPGLKLLHVDSRIMETNNWTYVDSNTYTPSTKNWQIAAANTDDFSHDGTAEILP